MRKKNNVLKLSSHPSLLPGSTSLPGSLPAPHTAEQGYEEGVLQSVQHILSMPPLLPQWEEFSTLPLLQHGVPPIGDSLPQVSAVLVFPTSCNFHKLLQQGSLPQGQSFRSSLLSVGLLQVLTEHLLLRGSCLHGATGPASVQVSHGVIGPCLLWCGVWQDLQGNLYSNTWSTSFPSSFTDPNAFKVASLTYSHPCLPAAAAQKLYPFLICYHRSTTTIADELSFGQWQVHLGTCWNEHLPTQGHLLMFLQKPPR